MLTGYLTAEFLVGWLKSANVAKYENPGKTIVFVAKKDNEELFFSLDRTKDCGHPDISVIWLKDGETQVVHQDIKQDGEKIHSVGNLWGEDLEEICVALFKNSDK